MTNFLSRLTTHELVKRFDRLILEEREAISQVILHLAEIDRRKIYAIEGYSSLFNYCVEKYHYFESAAYLRIQAARMARAYPRLINDIEQGKLSLTTIKLISPYVTPENHGTLFEKVSYQSKYEVEKIIAKLFPREDDVSDKIRRLPVKYVRKTIDTIPPYDPEKIEDDRISSDTAAANEKDIAAPVNKGEKNISECLSPLMPLEQAHSNNENSIASSTQNNQSTRSRPSTLIKKRADEKILPLTPHRVKIEFSASEEFANKIRRLKELMRHKYPEGKLEDVFHEVVEMYLEKKDPERKFKNYPKGIDERKAPVEKTEMTHITEIKNSSQADQNNRYIPQAIQRQIWERDRGKCRYKSPQGKQCSEKGGLELDHIEPWALGGRSSVGNLRLLCHAHNQLRAKLTFG